MDTLLLGLNTIDVVCNKGSVLNEYQSFCNFVVSFIICNGGAMVR